jgi:hypothetical protein
MIESYVQKVIFVDEPFLEGLKQKSMTDYLAFNAPQVDTKVIALPVPEADLNQLVQLMNPSDILPGSILVKPDYSDRFMSVEAFAEKHAERKYSLWVLLCLALGAKKVSVINVEEVRLESEEHSLTAAQVGGTSPVMAGEAGFKSGQASLNDEARKSILNIKVDASGGEPDLDEAERILSKHGLHKDDMFQRMYDMRSLKTNSLTKKEFSLDLSTDVKRVFDTSLKAKIKAMSTLYGGIAEFDKASKATEKGQTALKLSVLVEF